MHTSNRHNFDDYDSEIGFYHAITRFVDRFYGRSSEWWHTSHEKLGCSPLSALCEGRFDEVHGCWLGR